MKTAISNKNGITVKQLKEWVKDLPEVNEDNGEDYTVWIENYDHRGLSNMCQAIVTLNKGDVIFEHDIFN